MNDAAHAAIPSRRRRRALAVVLIVLCIAAAAVAAWWWLVLRHYATTDNAYVGGNLIPLTAETSGTVLAVAVDDTDRVEAGQVLVTLDAADALIAVDQAEADLAAAVRQVRGLFAEVTRQEAQVVARRVDTTRADADLARRQGLPADGAALSAEDLQHARDAVEAARAALKLAEETLAAARVQVQEAAIDTHPLVLAAAARVRQALLAEARTRVRAPSAGWVAKRTVQIGQRIQAGMPLLSIVPLDGVWVDANFKENQLADVRIGQQAVMHADLYGGAVTFHGKVVGLGAGTGAAFATIPAQNASGNWIKIVQRLPVRIALNRKELEAHPLRVGLSITVDVSIDDRSGQALTAATRSEPAARTDAVGGLPPGVEERIASIIARNRADAPPPAPAR